MWEIIGSNYADRFLKLLKNWNWEDWNIKKRKYTDKYQKYSSGTLAFYKERLL